MFETPKQDRNEHVQFALSVTVVRADFDASVLPGDASEFEFRYSYLNVDVSDRSTSIGEGFVHFEKEMDVFRLNATPARLISFLETQEFVVKLFALNDQRAFDAASLLATSRVRLHSLAEVLEKHQVAADSVREGFAITDASGNEIGRLSLRLSLEKVLETSFASSSSSSSSKHRGSTPSSTSSRHSRSRVPLSARTTPSLVAPRRSRLRQSSTGAGTSERMNAATAAASSEDMLRNVEAKRDFVKLQNELQSALVQVETRERRLRFLEEDLDRKSRAKMADLQTVHRRMREENEHRVRMEVVKRQEIEQRLKDASDASKRASARASRLESELLKVRERMLDTGGGRAEAEICRLRAENDELRRQVATANARSKRREETIEALERTVEALKRATRASVSEKKNLVDVRASASSQLADLHQEKRELSDLKKTALKKANAKRSLTTPDEIKREIRRFEKERTALVNAGFPKDDFVCVQVQKRIDSSKLRLRALTAAR